MVEWLGERRICRPRRVFTIALGAALVWLVGGCAKERGPQPSQAIAKVNGQDVTRQQLWSFLEMGDNGDAGRRALDALIVRQLVRQEAQKRNVEVSAEEIKSRLDGMKDYLLATTGKDFASWLKDTGQTEDDLGSRISTQVLTAKLVIPEKDREAFFEANKNELKKLPHNNESVIFRQIVLPSREEAEAIRKELTTNKKADFAKLAEDRSLDPMTRSRGGMAGWVVKGKMAPPDPELEKVLFSLKPGEIKGPLPVSAGSVQGQAAPDRWRIVKVEKHLQPQAITLKNNEDIVEEEMLNDPRFQMQLQQFFLNLRSEAKVEILDPRYQGLSDVYGKAPPAPQPLVGPTAPAPLAPPAGEVPAPQSQPAPKSSAKPAAPQQQRGR